MSVVKTKRGEGKMVVITKSNELAVYTIKICSNEKHFPKHYRWCITNKIVDAALEINNNATKANAVYVNCAEDLSLRKSYQMQAIASTYSLLSMIDIAYRTFGIESDRIEYWTKLVSEVQRLLRQWRKSDNERYKDLG